MSLRMREPDELNPEKFKEFGSKYFPPDMDYRKIPMNIRPDSDTPAKWQLHQIIEKIQEEKERLESRYGMRIGGLKLSEEMYHYLRVLVLNDDYVRMMAYSYDQSTATFYLNGYALKMDKEQKENCFALNSFELP